MKYSIEYTENLPEQFGGYVEFPSLLMRLVGDIPLIKIRGKYRGDKGLLAHEIKHVEQYYRHWYHGLWYTLSKEYRYACELEAYKEQIAEYKYQILADCTWIIDSLHTKYGVDKERGEILEDVLGILRESKAYDRGN